MKKHQLLLSAVLLSLAAGCSNAPSGPGGADGAYQRGVAALAKGQPREARIEFLNAIKANPNDGKIRLAQARTYLLLGDGVAAEAEITRARALKVPLAETHHLMAEALLLQKRPEEAIAEAAKAPPAFAAQAARMRGRGYMALGDAAKAGVAFGEALAAGANDSLVWTDVARFRRGTSDIAGAVAAADKAVQLDARNVDALSLRGELTRTQYGLAAAIPWFDRALQIDPNHIPALVERAATLGDLGRMKEMLAETRKILAISPNNPVAYYLQAMLAARAKKFDLARSLFQRTSGALDDKPAGMLLASAIDFETGNAEQAIARLQKLVGAQPGNVKARRLLAASQWKLGDVAGTIQTLRPLADRPDADSYVLTLIGKAYDRQGNADLASRYLARAAEPQRRTATALLDSPVDDAQIAALRRKLEASPKDAQLQVQLIRALLGRGLGGEALQRAQALQAGSPGVPDAHVLVGDARGIMGDYKGAVEEYRKAANLAFTEPVAMRLIEALRNSGNSGGAARVLELYLTQNPQNVPAQLLAANAFLQAKQWDGAIAIYERLRTRVGDRDATLLNNLAWAYSEKGDYGRALPAAQKAWSLDKKNPATTDTYGWLLYKSGKDKAQGMALLEQASRGAPSNAEIRDHLAAARRG
ncbi:MAG TPA: tetratricopeptide repeat protein [Allosphingosinicella sp.]|jgi:tetratricopeptide (TPR) repeat protein